MLGLLEICDILRGLGCSRSQVYLSHEGQNLHLVPDQHHQFIATDILGSGGSGCVLKCHTASHDESIALKVPLRAPDVTERVRFRREFITIQNVRHPCIVRSLENGYFETVDHPWLTMELVQGTPLSAHYPHSNQSADGIAEILQSGLEWFLALVALHETDCVHRDLKPGNIIWTDARQWVIVDFGLCVMRNGAHQSNINHLGPGTLVYMPFEQLLHDADVQSDQFSIAFTLYEWLTGRHPYHQTGILCEDKRPDSKFLPELAHVHNPLVPKDVSELLAQMLRQDKSKRLPSMREAAIRLSAAIAKSSRGSSQDRSRLNKSLIAYGRTREISRQIIGFRKALGTLLTELYFSRKLSDSDRSDLIRDPLETCKRLRESLVALVSSMDDETEFEGLISASRCRSECVALIQSVDRIAGDLDHLLRIKFACDAAMKVLENNGWGNGQSVEGLLSVVERHALHRTDPLVDQAISLEQVVDIATGQKSILDFVSSNREVLLDPIRGVSERLGEVQEQLAHLDGQIVGLEGVGRVLLR